MVLHSEPFCCCFSQEGRQSAILLGLAPINIIEKRDFLYTIGLERRHNVYKAGNECGGICRAVL